jgi:DNA polymerase-3 subunit epsilon
MKYLALDVETANSDYSSLCQIGIAEFDNGKVINKWSSLINPEDYFDFFNIELHGIDGEAVKDAPTFPEVYEKLSLWLTNKITVHHMPFDRVAIARACEKYELPIVQSTWLDSAKIARRTWEEIAHKGYGLANLAAMLNIDFEHHDALEDAIAAGLIVYEASTIKELTIEDWVDRANKPINLYQGGSSTIKIDGNPDGSLFGEQLVFTGTLSLTRAEAGKIAADLGCSVTNSVTKKTTMLVVGIQDSYKLVGHEKSSKHRKAEEHVKKGTKIKILSEDDFKKILELDK